MLTQLSVTNFAIVKQLAIDWQKGMTAITGETGAGKSIAIDALGLALGDRATTQVVRNGADRADINASFQLDAKSPAKAWLTQHELEAEDDCILRRVITKDGRSSAYINGQKVPLAQVRELSPLLINIHGQHDHQLLTKPQHQLALVDAYADHPTLLENVKHAYQSWLALKQEYAQLQQSQQQRESQKQLLQYQVTELDEFNLQPEEFGQLEQDYQRQSNAQQLLQACQQASFELNDNEQTNVVEILTKQADIFSQLQSLDPTLADIANMLQEAQVVINEASSELNNYQQRFEHDPALFADIEQRYSTAINLAKKHQVTPEQLVEHHSQLSQALSLINSDDSRLTTILQDIEQAEQDYLFHAQQLTQSRQQAAKQLSTEITTSMHELNMADGKFFINVGQTEQAQQYRANGIDQLMFEVTMNPGQPLEPLHKVASGGELSRISLAMQVILAKKVVAPSMIFDEVDVGISGPTAAMVGEKLKQLGGLNQVICVTHLPQVASKAHQQLFVSKLTDGKQTETTMTKLSSKTRVREIARLLAGDKITEQSLANAEALLAS